MKKLYYISYILLLLFYSMPYTAYGMSLADYIAINGQPELDDGTLDLSGKGINSLDGIQMLEEPSIIDLLLLQENHISDLPIDIFSQFVNLEHLNLQRNKLMKIWKGSFNGLENLQELHLEGNQLVNLPAGAFEGAETVQTLHLNENKLRTVDPTVFRELYNLQTLYISGNHQLRDEQIINFEIDDSVELCQ